MKDRLTKRVGDGICYDNGEYIVTCYPKNNNLTPVDKLTVKLCDLEDKIESGAVIVPPCKVGDKVYQQDGVSIYESIIEEIMVDVAVGRPNKTIFYTDKSTFDETAIGQSIFLTKEEAEKALKGAKE